MVGQLKTCLPPAALLPPALKLALPTPPIPT